VRPVSIEANDPKLWSKLASSLVRDTLDSTLVVISTDPRRTAKAAGGRKVEMYCRYVLFAVLIRDSADRS
jgi:hypothetical protein